MGLELFVKSGTFYPAEHGLYTGDLVNVVAVGSGGHGFGWSYENSSQTTTRGSGAGTDTSFGSYCVARSAYGAPGGTGVSLFTGYSGYYMLTPAGGGGGWVPGAPFQGGTGATTPQAYDGQTVVLTGNGGGAQHSGYKYSNEYYYKPCSTMGGNGACFGGGQSGNSWYGEGGAGYGAGGGSAGSSSNNSDAYYYWGSVGGWGGEIVYHTHVITEDDVIYGIPVTIGQGTVYISNSRGMAVGKVHNKDGATENVPTWSQAIWQVPDWEAFSTYSAGLLSKKKLQARETNGYSYGYIAPVFSFRNGLTILCNNFSTSAQTTFAPTMSYVYVSGASQVYSFTECFPGFSTSYAPIYLVGDYFVQLYNINSSYCYMRYILASKALSGNATSADVKTMQFTHNIGNSYATYLIGFTYDGALIIGISSTTYAYYANWTPSTTATSYASVALSSGSFMSYQCYVMPCGSNQFRFCRVSSSSASTTTVYVTNAAAGTVSATKYYHSFNLYGWTEGTNYVNEFIDWYTSSYSSWAYTALDITAAPQQTSGMCSLSYYVYVDGSLKALYPETYVSVPTSNVYSSGIVWPMTDGRWTTWSHVNSTNSSLPYFLQVYDMAPYGTANTGGQPSQPSGSSYSLNVGGGSSGCCQITW